MCLEGEEDVDEQSKKDPSKYPSDCGSFLFSFHQYSVWENSMFFVSMYHLYVVLDLGGIRRRLSSSTFYSSYHITLQWKEQDKVTDWQWRVLDWRKVQGRTGQGDLKDLKEQIWRNRASWQTWRNRARWQTDSDILLIPFPGLGEQIWSLFLELKWLCLVRLISQSIIVQ